MDWKMGLLLACSVALTLSLIHDEFPRKSIQPTCSHWSVQESDISDIAVALCDEWRTE